MPTQIISEPPSYEVTSFAPKRTRYCFCTITWNEGERIKKQLQRMKERSELADIIIGDGHSNDGSMDPEYLKSCGVRTLLTTDERGLSTATRMVLDYALKEGYEGIVTVDGNGKDGVEALPEFLRGLDEGFDLVQGSRFMKGGYHKNTPLIRELGIRFIMAPILWLGTGVWYTDSTNAFRALSARFLRDKRVQPLRKIFVRFNLQDYLIFKVPQLGYKVKQIPVKRVYPDDGSVPTKIHGWKLNFLDLWEMIETVWGKYDPE